MRKEQISMEIVNSICPNLGSNYDDDIISGFIYKLSEESDITSLRLLVCIGIDIRNSQKVFLSLDPLVNTYVNKIRKCILIAESASLPTTSFPSGLTNRWKFTWALNQIPLTERVPCEKSTSKDNYSRVSSFRDYMYYTVNTNIIFNSGIDIITQGPHDLVKYYMDFINDKKQKYRRINVGILDHSRYYFIVDENDLTHMGYSNLSLIIDGLGFYIDNVKKDDFFVCVQYDVNFIENTWQPDTLSGDWGNINSTTCRKGNDFFLSYPKSNGWGKTYSVSGKVKGLKEKIHLPFNNTGKRIYNMRAKDLGSLSNGIEMGHQFGILKEALDRYFNA
jgi:hypothetical protein